MHEILSLIDDNFIAAEREYLIIHITKSWIKSYKSGLYKYKCETTENFLPIQKTIHETEAMEMCN